MITQTTLDFLTRLKQNNTREWFQEQKKDYETAKKEVEIFIGELIPAISRIDPLIQSPDVKDCLFRIFKDVRFSKDKSPYKTNFGAFIGRGGRKTIYPGYYIHIEPGESMIAGGVYQPQPDTLKLLRNEVYFNAAEFRGILNSGDFLKYFGSLDEFDKMKKVPREYPADFPEAELLKYRSLIVSQMVPDTKVSSPGYKDYVLEVVKAMQPLNAFLNRAISNG